MMLKFIFLINPISGGGQGKLIYKYLPEIMESMGFQEEEWRAEFTRSEDLVSQIDHALKSTETLIAVGGDGTVSAVFSVLLDSCVSTSVKIGVIPLGTGNDLARVLNLYKPFVNKGLLFLVRSLLMANTQPFDVWKVNGKQALANYFSSGIDARIAHDFNKARSQGEISGRSVLANKIHYVKRFFTDRDYFLSKGSVSVVNSNGTSKIYNVSGYRTVIIGNIPSFASGANPFLNSKMSDQLLEVVFVPNLFAFFGAILLGNIPIIGFLYKTYFLKSVKAKSILLELNPSEFHQLDGEDLTHKLGSKITIEYGMQVQILSLR